MTPEAIKGHADRARTKLENVRKELGSYAEYKAVKDVFAIADDLCELIAALAENQQLMGEALSPSTTIIVESKGD